MSGGGGCAAAFAGRNHCHKAAQFPAAAFKLGHFALIFAIADLHVAEFDFYKVEQGLYGAFRDGHDLTTVILVKVKFEFQPDMLNFA